jgi:di/tricarboxylate transporter
VTTSTKMVYPTPVAALVTLSRQEVALIVIVIVAIILIISSKVRADIVALMVLLALGLSRILPAEKALSGFSAPAVVTIIGLFVITATLERVGIVRWVADRLARLSGTSLLRMMLVFMGAGALLSLVMNNIAAGAVLLPAAVSVSRKKNVPASKLLMPLAFGTLLGGMATLFTTANIIVSGSLQAQGQRPLTMLDFLPVGGAMVITGTAYMLLIGRRLLPERQSMTRAILSQQDLVQTYQLAERLWEVQVQSDSPLVRQHLADTLIGARLGLTVVGIWHGREAKIPPSPADIIEADDILLVLGREERVRQLEPLHTIIGRDGHHPQIGYKISVSLSEVVIAPRSPVVGKTLKELRHRNKFGLTTVALWREGRSYRTDVGDFVLQPGDALLMVGPPERIRQLAEEPGYIVLDHPSEAPAQPDLKTFTALAITAAVIVLSAAGVLPTAEAMIAGATLLVLTGCMSMEEAYHSVEWKVIVLIGGMLPIGPALQETGLALQIGHAFTSGLAPWGPMALIGGLYLFSVMLTQVMGGQISALVVAPVAISAAAQMGVNASAVGVAVSVACSAAFLTPIAHPVNVLMMGPGGYTFKDFFRVGVGLTTVCFITLLVVMPLFWNI